MDFIKDALNEVELKGNNLYDFMYDLLFYAKLKESEDDIKNNRVCTLEELKEYIDNLEAEYENPNNWQCKIRYYKYI